MGRMKGGQVIPRDPADRLDGVFTGQGMIRPIDHLGKLPTGDPVRLKDGTLVKAGSPLVYVISNGSRRPILNEDAFLALGYRWNDIVTVDARTLELHPEGESLALPKEEDVPVTILSATNN